MVVIWEGASGRSKRPACWFLVGNEGEISIQSLYELESKLLKGGLYRGLYRGLLWGVLSGILGV